MALNNFPFINALLNTCSFILLMAGYISIKNDKKIFHRNCMVLALITSACFLVFYLFYHYNFGSKRFPELGLIKTIYLVILFTHTILATAMVPMIVKTFYHAFKGQWDKHKKIARLTLPVWIYVSFTGILIYLMLYQLPKFLKLT
ncbi:MAG: DUF420 domain-containing protein [Halobacteriovoraceae bacterium]|nr:DUF420 domain-containing protein [Halobacteriovoraceae bacterium]